MDIAIKTGRTPEIAGLKMTSNTIRFDPTTMSIDGKSTYPPPNVPSSTHSGLMIRAYENPVGFP